MNQSGQRCSSFRFSVAPQKTQARPVRCGSVADKKPQPTQKTQPKEGKPIEVPVPKRSDFDKVLERAMKGSTAHDAIKRRPSE